MCHYKRDHLLFSWIDTSIGSNPWKGLVSHSISHKIQLINSVLLMGPLSPALEVDNCAPNDANMPQGPNEWPERNARGYKLLEQPYGTMRPIRVVFIGAGASGICFSKFAKDLLINATVQVYEKNADIGGTWLENR